MSDIDFKNRFANADIADLDFYFLLACENGRLDEVKYLLTSPELKEHPSLVEDNAPLNSASYSNNVEIVKYLLSSPDLKEHANIYAQEAESFKLACNHQADKVLEYLIFEFNIEKTKDIRDFLESTKTPFNEKVNNMFILREVNQDLNQEMSNENKNLKKPKL